MSPIAREFADPHHHCSGVPPRDLDLGFYLFRGGMKPHGLGKERDDIPNAALETALRPIADAAQALGGRREEAKLLMVDAFAHAAGLLLLAHTGRIRMFGASASNLMERYIDSPWPGIADYSASKAAVAAYTRGWARDLGPRGITVNVIHPGPIDTGMNPADGPSSDLQQAGTALGRYGRPEEIGAMVAFLAGQGAAFITGASIDVDGGVNA